MVCSCLLASTNDRNNATNTSSNDGVVNGITLTTSQTLRIRQKVMAEKAMICALKIHF